MNQDILLSKIVPNSTDTTWAQAYTTLNVYITLSIESEEGASHVATTGKELLEKLQREFFALDEKNLENIKKAVGNVSKSISPNLKYSILVGAIVKNILYIVIASKGEVIIKRGDKAGTIAKGVENELQGFSGKLMHDDIVLIETGDFSDKITLENLEEHLKSSDVLKIAEDITPLIHENSKGTESAIILQYKDLTKISQSEESETFPNISENEAKEDLDTKTDGVDENIGTSKSEYIPGNLWTKPTLEKRNIEELADEENEQQEIDHEETKSTSSFFPSFLKFKPHTSNFLSKKTIILAVIILLILALVGSILFENHKKEQSQINADFSKIYQPAKQNYDTGVSLENLNKTQALTSLTASKKLLQDSLSKFPKNSSEYKMLSDLLSKVNDKIQELGGGSSAKNVQEILKAGSKLSKISSVTVKGGQLIVGGENKVALVSNDGTVSKTFDTNNTPAILLTADDKFIYVLGGGSIVRIDKGNGKTTTAVKNANGIALDSFGSNIYTLQTSDVTKYKAPSYDPTSYFTSKPTFTATPIDMSIAGPIYILEKDGHLQSFTKGKDDNFTLSGLTAPFADDARIYTDQDFANIYVLDVKNQRVVVLNDKGEFQTQYEGSFIKNANSFAIDEKNKKGFVVSNNILYSFDL
jgi:hypothetical protein